jgi:hypothetical protein
MYFLTLFLCWRDPRPELSRADLALVRERLARVAGLRRALGFTPISISPDQPYAADGRGPAFTLELRFDDARTLENADLGDLMTEGALPSLGGGRAHAQAMWGRDFAAPDPVFRSPEPCTFLVEYPGECAEPTAWLDHYDSHHPKIMVRFPEVREVATFRPAPELRLALPGDRDRSMQRNKVVFDSGEKLVEALASPIMIEMRADAAGLPPVARRPTHHPMATHELTSLGAIP